MLPQLQVLLEPNFDKSLCVLLWEEEVLRPIFQKCHLGFERRWRSFGKLRWRSKKKGKKKWFHSTYQLLDQSKLQTRDVAFEQRFDMRSDPRACVRWYAFSKYSRWPSSTWRIVCLWWYRASEIKTASYHKKCELVKMEVKMDRNSSSSWTCFDCNSQSNISLVMLEWQMQTT